MTRKCKKGRARKAVGVPASGKGTEYTNFIYYTTFKYAVRFVIV